MLVIKGSTGSGKSRKGVKEYLEGLTDGVETLIINNEGLQYHEFIEQEKLSVDVYVESVYHEINVEDLTKVVGEFNRVVFDLSVNANKIEEFNNLSKELGIETVLTVQSNDRELSETIKVYQV